MLARGLLSFASAVPPRGGYIISLRVVGFRALSTSSSSVSSPATPLDPEIQSAVLTACSDLHSSILPLNARLRGPLGSSSASATSDTTSLPFVLLVGNHSSGKSSFVNHVLGRPVQTAGVAPTDDSFTVIAPGPQGERWACVCHRARDLSNAYFRFLNIPALLTNKTQHSTSL